MAEAYAEFDQDIFAQKLEVLRRHRGARADHWQALLKAKQPVALATALMEDHYDPSYRAARAQHDPTVLRSFKAVSLNTASRQLLAEQIAEWLAARPK